MSVSMSYLSGDEINQSDFNMFLSELGVDVNLNDSSKSTWSCDEGHLWISRDDDLVQEYEDGDINAIKNKLNATPKSIYLVELSDEVGSSQLAIRFAYKFGMKWSIVVDDLYENTYSFSDIETIYKDGKGFE